MGNSALGGSLCNGLNFPYQVTLGRYVAVKVIKIKENKLEDQDEEEDKDEDEVENEKKIKDEEEDEDEDDDEEEEEEDDDDDDEIPNILTKVTYTIYRRAKCEMEFRISDNLYTTSFTLGDSNKTSALKIHFTIRKVESSYLEVSRFAPKFNHIRKDRHFDLFMFKSTCDSSMSNEEWRGFTESNFLIYETERIQGGLVVVERKKKSKYKKPFMVTISHYYYIRDLYIKSLTINIGLSVIVKVESLKNGGLYCTTEGPTHHPPAALLYMIDEVGKTGIWSPTACPHCATLEEKQSSREKGSFSRRGINNDGTFKGNGSGNMIQGDFNQFTIYK
ncbi:unnamed protein product [Lathyrus sativus]|nr:unnamed protein product [Lathyrus sativus]